jgi:hypothetical protein
MKKILLIILLLNLREFAKAQLNNKFKYQLEFGLSKSYGKVKSVSKDLTLNPGNGII